MDKYKIIEEKEPILTIDKNLVEIQKMIIYYGEKIIEEIKKLKIDSKVENNSSDEQITKHLKQIIIPQGYGGNNLK